MEELRPYKGKRVLLGVTGSIAAYKAADILRRLQDLGVDVRVAMTAHAARFVAPLTFEALTGKPVLLDEFSQAGSGGIGHISATDGIDCLLIAPATANIIGKMAAGIADDALTSAVLAASCPIIVAPAMNERMYRNPLLQRNIASLKGSGVRLVEPGAGALACGTEGKGRLADTALIIETVRSVLPNHDLAGKTVLVTAGPTREYLDAVRFISNPSSGKMGYALADAARDRGADVVLISGPSHLERPRGVVFIPVISAADMHRAVMDHYGRSDIIIMAAAVSDFRPRVRSERKIKKTEASDMINLERTEDILLSLGKQKGGRLLVGFAAETEDIEQNALRKLREKELDLIVVNDVLRPGAGFESDTNAVTILDREGGRRELEAQSKAIIAHHIIDTVCRRIAMR